MSASYPQAGGDTPKNSDEGGLAGEQVQPHRRALIPGADLDQVAELVGEPEAAAALLRDVGAQPAHQWLLDPTLVFDLGQQPALLVPEPQLAGAAPVHDAVGG